MAGLTRVRRPVLALIAGAVGVLVVGLPTSAQAVYTCFGKTATIVGSMSGTTIKGTAGNDVIVARAGNDKIYAGAGNDLICAGDGADYVDGGAGNDKIDGGTGQLTRNDAGAAIVLNDTLVGGPGDDFFSPVFDGRAKPGDAGDKIAFIDSLGPVQVDAAAHVVTGNGTDTWIGQRAAILGSPFNDVFVGSPSRDVFNGMGGSDTIDGAGGDDTIRDDDPAAGRSQPDSLSGGDGNDQLFTWGGFDTLSGGPGDDTLYDYGRDAGVMRGDAGRDTIYDALAPDPNQVVDGGDDADTVVLYTDFATPSRPRLTIDLGIGQAQFQGDVPVDFVIAGAENLSVFGYAVTYYGSEFADRISTDGTGALQAEGRGGDDYLVGTYLDDFLDGGDGTDTAVPRGGHNTCLSIESVVSGTCN